MSDIYLNLVKYVESALSPGFLLDSFAHQSGFLFSLR